MPARSLRVDRNSKSVVERRALAYDRTPDFPAIDTRLSGSDYDEFWMLGISAAGLPGRKFSTNWRMAPWSRGAVD